MYLGGVDFPSLVPDTAQACLPHLFRSDHWPPLPRMSRATHHIWTKSCKERENNIRSRTLRKARDPFVPVSLVAKTSIDGTAIYQSMSLQRPLLNGPKRRRAPRASQACNNCAAAKARCDNNKCCQRCQRRNIPCIRPHSFPNNGSTGVENSDQPQSIQILSGQGSPMLDVPGDSSMEDVVFGSTEQGSSVPAVLESLQSTSCEPTGVIIFPFSICCTSHLVCKKKLIMHPQKIFLKAQQVFCRWVQK